jgi:hypothetical protein
VHCNGLGEVIDSAETSNHDDAQAVPMFRGPALIGLSESLE